MFPILLSWTGRLQQQQVQITAAWPCGSMAPRKRAWQAWITTHAAWIKSSGVPYPASMRARAALSTWMLVYLVVSLTSDHNVTRCVGIGSNEIETAESQRGYFGRK